MLRLRKYAALSSLGCRCRAPNAPAIQLQVATFATNDNRKKKKHQNGNHRSHTSKRQQPPVQNEKKTGGAVFTNKFQNLLSFAFEAEEDEQQTGADRKQSAKPVKKRNSNKKTVTKDNEPLSLKIDLEEPSELESLESLNLTPQVPSESRKKQSPKHKTKSKERHQPQGKPKQDTSKPKYDANKPRHGSGKKRERGYLQHFKFETSLFDDDAEVFTHVDWGNNFDDGEKEFRARRREKKQQEKQERVNAMRAQVKKQEVEIPSPSVSVRDLADRMNVKTRVLIRALRDLGEGGLHEDSYVTSEVAEVAVEALSMIPVLLPPEFVDLELTTPPKDTSHLPSRPPVVSVMGHVDHGKTTLLDALRKSQTAQSEAGGITQKIGAFSVDLGKQFGKMTFIDTPGHAAFSNMRSRGAQLTDVLVLVVAADDGVQPQTQEAIELARQSGTPVVVAITKCDMHAHDKDEVVRRIGEELMKHGLTSEGMGGDTPLVCVSGKTGDGLQELKETIALHSEVLELRADDKSSGEAVVMEANVAKGVGTQVDVLVKWGTLKSGDLVVCGLEYGKIKALVDEKNKRVKKVSPGMPCRVVGLKGLPVAGDALLTVESEEKAKEVIEHREELLEWDLMSSHQDESDEKKVVRRPTGRMRPWQKAALQRKQEEEETARRLQEEADGPNYVPIVVKTDAVGVISAIDELLASLPEDASAVVSRVASGVGPVTSSDVAKAAASNATIFAFNAKAPAPVSKEALGLNVEIRNHNVVYSLLDDLKELLDSHSDEMTQKHVVGSAEIVQAIPIGTGGRRTAMVAGCKVTSGSLSLQSKYRLLRDGEVVAEDVNMGSMRHFQDKVSSVTKGQECGLQFDDLNDFRPGDVLEAYKVERVKKESVA